MRRAFLRFLRVRLLDSTRQTYSIYAVIFVLGRGTGPLVLRSRPSFSDRLNTGTEFTRRLPSSRKNLPGERPADKLCRAHRHLGGGTRRIVIDSTPKSSAVVN
jgi:hypothetical protein